MTSAPTACPAHNDDRLARLLSRDGELIRCPYPLYADLRESAPVQWSDELSSFILTRYEDIVEVLRNPTLYSSRMASGPSSVTGLAEKLKTDPRTTPELMRCVDRRLKLHQSPVLVVSDPPLHKRQRQLVSLAFTPRRVKTMEPEVRRVAGALTDAALSSDRMDFVNQFAIPLPLTVIAGVLGVPDERLHDFKRWSDAFTRGVGSLDPTFEQIEALFFSVDEFYDYFTEQLEMRRTDPRDDLLTDLLAARMDGAEPLSLDEMLQMISQFLVGGNETTTSLLGAIMLRLATDPALLSLVKGDYDLLVPLAEEMLRLEPPVQGTFRIADADVEISGCSIPKGSMLWLVYGSANRDMEGCGAGDDIVWKGAANRQHLSFGRGEHYCLGAAVARLEVRVGLEVLLRQLHGVRLIEQTLPPMMPSFVFHGLATLPLAISRADRRRD